jgi:hypothetical protein
MAATLAMPTRVPLPRARMEGRGGSGVVDGEGARHHVDVFPLGAVHAHADTGIGDYHIGQALGVDTGLASGHNAVDIGNVGAVDATSRCIQAL